MDAEKKATSLLTLIDSTSDLVAYLSNDTTGPHSRIRADLNPLPTGFTN
jgi:hypothetical protein